MSAHFSINLYSCSKHKFPSSAQGEVTQLILQFTSSTPLPQGEARHQLLFKFCYPQTQIYYRTFLVSGPFISTKISSFSPHQDSPKGISNHSLQRNFDVCISNTLKLVSSVLYNQVFDFPSSPPKN